MATQHPLPSVSAAVRAASSGADMLALPRWAVVGDALNEAKVAHQVAARLRAKGKEVHVVNPREKDGRCPTSLRDCPPVDVVDLIIHPALGLAVIDEMAAAAIPNVFIQPGAGSEEIIAKCEKAGIAVHQGCVLMELV
eukprot:EG_transcript_31783